MKSKRDTIHSFQTENLAKGSGRLFYEVLNRGDKISLLRRAAGKGQAAQDAAVTKGDIEASVALVFTSAIAALGMFFIPVQIAISIDTTGTPQLALGSFAVFYATCVFATWWWHRRGGAEVRSD